MLPDADVDPAIRGPLPFVVLGRDEHRHAAGKHFIAAVFPSQHRLGRRAIVPATTVVRIPIVRTGRPAGMAVIDGAHHSANDRAALQSDLAQFASEPSDADCTTAVSGTRVFAISAPQSERSVEPDTGRQVENANDVETVGRGINENLFRVGIERAVAVNIGDYQRSPGHNRRFR